MVGNFSEQDFFPTSGYATSFEFFLWLTVYILFSLILMRTLVLLRFLPHPLKNIMVYLSLKEKTNVIDAILSPHSPESSVPSRT